MPIEDWTLIALQLKSEILHQAAAFLMKRKNIIPCAAHCSHLVSTNRANRSDRYAIDEDDQNSIYFANDTASFSYRVALKMEFFLLYYRSYDLRISCFPSFHNWLSVGRYLMIRKSDNKWAVMCAQTHTF